MTVVQQKLLIQFLADDAFMRKYEEARSLLSQRLPDTSFANVFEALINEFLEHSSPARRKERRDARRDLKKAAHARAQQAEARPAPVNPSHAPAPARTQQATAKPAPAIQSREPVQQKQAKTPRMKDHTPSRHIPAAIRDEVFTRDKGRCTYIGKTGKRCESTQALQIDHIVPFARGGPATAENLRLLCAKHNKIAAAEIFGEAFTRQFRSNNMSVHQRE